MMTKEPPTLAELQSLRESLQRANDTLDEIARLIGCPRGLELSALRTLPNPLTALADERQRVVAAWTIRCFGEAMMTPHERTLRVLEEALELAQAERLPWDDVMRLAHYVYQRPPGEPLQELGGLRLTILAYAAAKGVSADGAEAAELARVLAKDPEHFRVRNLEKAAAGVGDYKP